MAVPRIPIYVGRTVTWGRQGREIDLGPLSGDREIVNGTRTYVCKSFDCHTSLADGNDSYGRSSDP